MAAAESLAIDNAEEIIPLITVFVNMLNYITILTPVFKFYLTPCAIWFNKNVIAVTCENVLSKNLCGWELFVMAIILVGREAPFLM